MIFLTNYLTTFWPCSLKNRIDSWLAMGHSNCTTNTIRPWMSFFFKIYETSTQRQNFWLAGIISQTLIPLTIIKISCWMAVILVELCEKITFLYTDCYFHKMLSLTISFVNNMLLILSYVHTICYNERFICE